MFTRCLLLCCALVFTAACSGERGKLDKARERVFHKDFTGAAALYHTVLIDLGRDESPQARDLRAAALSALGDLYYLNLDDPAQAVRNYRELAERYPERPEAFDARAHLAEILKDKFHDTRAALAQLAALVQSFPNHLDTDRYQYRAAQDYFELRDYAQTETELKLLLARYPGSGVRIDAQMLLASSLALQGRRPEALALYAQIAREHPGADAGRANFEVARLYEESREYDKAETALAKALADHPEPTLVAAALERVKKRAARVRPVDIHDHAAVFDHKVAQNALQGEGGD